MAKNNEVSRYLNLKNATNDLKLELKKISDVEYDKISIPTFDMISLQDYIKYNYELNLKELDKKLSKQTYKLVKSNYLPKLTLNASIGKTDYQNENSKMDFDRDFYSYGLTLSIPLDINTRENIQENRLKFLRSQANLIDLTDSKKIEYKKTADKIKIYKEKIKIEEKNIILYDELIALTKEEVQTGDKTEYDLKTLINLKKIAEYEIEINKVNIQLELSKLQLELKK